MTAPRIKDPRDSRKWKAFRLTILARDGYTCGYCGQDANTVDHIIPIKDHPDAAFNPDNCISACKSCNSAKGSRSEGVFLSKRFTPNVFKESISPTTTSTIQTSPMTVQPKPNQ